jgi:hypothetical protein
MMSPIDMRSRDPSATSVIGGAEDPTRGARYQHEALEQAVAYRAKHER